MRKELNKSRYILAAILTIIIFASGIGIGLVMEKARMVSAEQSVLTQKLALSSLQVQQLYFDTYNISSCESINKLLESNLDDLDMSMKDVRAYNKKAVIDQENFELNLRNYFVTELQYFLISEKMKQTCDTNSAGVLYFYTETEESDRQGYVLDFIKKKFEDKVLIYSFNANFDQEPMINMLTESYGLKSFPSVVINGKTFEGYTTEEEISKQVCGIIKNQSPYCL